MSRDRGIWRLQGRLAVDEEIVYCFMLADAPGYPSITHVDVPVAAFWADALESL